LKCKKV